MEKVDCMTSGKSRLDDGTAFFCPSILYPVRDAFLDTLVDHVRAFDSIEAADLHSVPALEDLARRAHRIHGVAGMLGFVKLGKIAQALDHELCHEEYRQNLAFLINRLLTEMRLILRAE